MAIEEPFPASKKMKFTDDLSRTLVCVCVCVCMRVFVDTLHHSMHSALGAYRLSSKPWHCSAEPVGNKGIISIG